MLLEILRAHVRAIWFIYILWACFGIQVAFALLGVDIGGALGLQPRSLTGLSGIVFMHLLHGSMPHIILNSIGLFFALVPLYLVFQDDAHMPEAIIKIMLVSGILLWIFGRGESADGVPMVHIGASALSYGLATYTLFGGIFFRNAFLVVVSLAHFYWQGTAMIDGLNPMHVQVSWEGHACGAVAGLFVAFMQKKQMSGTNLPVEDNHHEIRSHRL